MSGLYETSLVSWEQNIDAILERTRRNLDAVRRSGHKPFRSSLLQTETLTTQCQEHKTESSRQARAADASTDASVAHEELRPMVEDIVKQHMRVQDRAFSVLEEKIRIVEAHSVSSENSIDELLCQIKGVDSQVQGLNHSYSVRSNLLTKLQLWSEDEEGWRSTVDATLRKLEAEATNALRKANATAGPAITSTAELVTSQELNQAIDACNEGFSAAILTSMAPLQRQLQKEMDEIRRQIAAMLHSESSGTSRSGGGAAASELLLQSAVRSAVGEMEERLENRILSQLNLKAQEEKRQSLANINEQIAQQIESSVQHIDLYSSPSTSRALGGLQLANKIEGLVKQIKRQEDALLDVQDRLRTVVSASDLHAQMLEKRVDDLSHQVDESTKTDSTRLFEAIEAQKDENADLKKQCEKIRAEVLEKIAASNSDREVAEADLKRCVTQNERLVKSMRSEILDQQSSVHKSIAGNSDLQRALQGLEQLRRLENRVLEGEEATREMLGRITKVQNATEEHSGHDDLRKRELSILTDRVKQTEDLQMSFGVRLHSVADAEQLRKWKAEADTSIDELRKLYQSALRDLRTDLTRRQDEIHVHFQSDVSTLQRSITNRTLQHEERLVELESKATTSAAALQSLNKHVSHLISSGAIVTGLDLIRATAQSQQVHSDDRGNQEVPLNESAIEGERHLLVKPNDESAAFQIAQTSQVPEEGPAEITMNKECSDLKDVAERESHVSIVMNSTENTPDPLEPLDPAADAYVTKYSNVADLNKSVARVFDAEELQKDGHVLDQPRTSSGSIKDTRESVVLTSVIHSTEEEEEESKVEPKENYVDKEARESGDAIIGAEIDEVDQLLTFLKDDDEPVAVLQHRENLDIISPRSARGLKCIESTLPTTAPDPGTPHSLREKSISGTSASESKSEEEVKVKEETRASLVLPIVKSDSFDIPEIPDTDEMVDYPEEDYIPGRSLESPRKQVLTMSSIEEEMVEPRDGLAIESSKKISAVEEMKGRHGVQAALSPLSINDDFADLNLDDSDVPNLLNSPKSTPLTASASDEKTSLTLERLSAEVQNAGDSPSDRNNFMELEGENILLSETESTGMESPTLYATKERKGIPSKVQSRSSDMVIEDRTHANVLRADSADDDFYNIDSDSQKQTIVSTASDTFGSFEERRSSTSISRPHQKISSGEETEKPDGESWIHSQVSSESRTDRLQEEEASRGLGSFPQIGQEEKGRNESQDTSDLDDLNSLSESSTPRKSMKASERFRQRIAQKRATKVDSLELSSDSD